jgi:hypothetical protein
MIKKYLLTTIVIIFISASLSMAQLSDKADLTSVKQDYLGLKPASKPFSIIDLTKLSWSHSYSLGYFSGGGVSGSMGLYTGLLFYEISPSLSLGLKLGIAHNPSAVFDRSASSETAFLPGLSLDYRPSNNFRLSIGIDSYMGNTLNPYQSYQNLPWRHNR